MALLLAGADGAPLGQVVDGNAVRLTAQLSAPAAADQAVSFALAGHPSLAGCTIPAGALACSVAVRADGWAWEAGERVAERELRATTADDPPLTAAAQVPVAPKPVVLVHGLNSDHTSWIRWIEPGGYLQQADLPGYAADDGQFDTRKMNTGNPQKPLAPTFSIAENARVLAEYVEAVRSHTGAERVDLVGHSLGGLISREYIQNLMPEVSAEGLPDVPAVNQFIIAGTPNGGTACGRPGAALRLYSPATSQITPEYLAQVFNPVVRDRRGVPFFAIAGDAVKDAAIRCSALPSDSLVSVDSVLNGISVAPDRITAKHADLNNGRPAFERIFRLLARSPGDYPIVTEGETTPMENVELLVQSTLVQGGTLEAGKTVSVTIPIDVASQASFMLYAPGSRVTMQIKTVAGKILTEETPKTNPKVSFERILEPSTPLSLGYGVIDPKAGPWEIGLTASETPPGGGPYAVMATVESDLRMTAEAAPGITSAGETVVLRAALDAPAPPQEVRAVAQVRLEGSDAEPVEVVLAEGGDGVFAAEFIPDAPGDWTAVVALTGRDADGNPFERLSVLGFMAK
jgi:pimeloyl-ACP methyl ester carboxylesterase